jgi:hypothetical protein
MKKRKNQSSSETNEDSGETINNANDRSGFDMI